MNILFYTHQFPGFGGIESVAATIAGELVRHGHEVSFLSHRAGCGTSIMTNLPSAVMCYKMPDVKHLVSAMNKGFVRRLVVEKRIDVIMYLDSYAAIEKNILGCEIGAKIITSEHSSPFYCTTEEHPERFRFISRIKQALRHGRFRLPYYYEGVRKRFLYDNSDCYVLLSNRFFGEFKAMARLLDSRKLRAIPNPIAPRLVPKTVDWGKKENLVLFVGTLAESKGAMKALETLKMLHCRNRIPQDWQVEILGDGPERDKCERFILENGLDFVSLKGYVDNPQPFYEKAKLLLFPSAREGFGMVLVEAMVNGCVPIAFSSYSSVFDIIHDGKNGALVDAFDMEKFAGSIHSLFYDQSRLRSMGEAAAKIASTFALSKIIDMWESLMSEVVRNA